MKDGAALGYSHGFNIVEVGEQIRKDITVVMVAPKRPGTEVREEYKRGLAYRRLSRYTRKTTRKAKAWRLPKHWAAATGGHRAGVLESSFVAEVKSLPDGRQTILCGCLQAGCVLRQAGGEGTDRAYAKN